MKIILTAQKGPGEILDYVNKKFPPFNEIEWCLNSNGETRLAL